MRILVTNDDGIDATGIAVLAEHMKAHGDVTVVAPNIEYSGSGASVGTLHLEHPKVKQTTLVDLPAYSVTGPPALCVFLAGLGLFGEFDLVVAGINPGANVGRSVYHSGTVGAALTARLHGWNAVAFSQKIDGWSIEGQGWEEMLKNQLWDDAGIVASRVVGELISDMPATPSVLNVNIPNKPVDEMLEWRFTKVASKPARSFIDAHLVPSDDPDWQDLKLDIGDPNPADVTTDVGAVAEGYVSMTWLGHL